MYIYDSNSLRKVEWAEKGVDFCQDAMKEYGTKTVHRTREHPGLVPMHTRVLWAHS